MAIKTPHPSTRTQLARLYGISPETLKKWMDDIPELSFNPRLRVLTPKQVALIYQHLGEPPSVNSD